MFFFITEWFPIYLVAKGIELKSGLIAVWIPFIAADVGSFFAGGFSGYLIKRGWSLGARAQSADYLWRNWHDPADPNHLHHQPLRDRISICGS